MNIRIRNKQESAYLIESLNLNKLQDIYLKKFDKSVVEKFLEENKAVYYAVRSRAVAGSRIFNLKVKREDVIDYVKDLSDFSINISSYGFWQNQLCTGEVKIGKDMGLSISVTNDPKASARDGAQKPDYNFVTTIEDKRVDKIKGMREVINYIFKHELFDMIVEFAAYNINVGRNNEKVVIFELRTDY